MDRMDAQDADCVVWDWQSGCCSRSAAVCRYGGSNRHTQGTQMQDGRYPNEGCNEFNGKTLKLRDGAARD